MEISASILNVDRENQNSTFYRLESAKIDYFHIDVMDGKFVENVTTELMQEYADNIKGISSVPLDIHLMVEDVRKYIDLYLPCSPRNISFHIERSGKFEENNAKFSTIDKKNVENYKFKNANQENIQEENSNEFKKIIEQKLRSEEEIFQTIDYIKENDIKVSLAINPETDIENVYKFLPYIHGVLVMSVHPGKGGQEFIENTVQNVKKLKNEIEKRDLETEIEVDGGINLDTIKEIKEFTDIAVVGKYLVDAKDYKYTVNSLKNC